jgi:uncharacterized protein (DUF1697 family)
MSGYVALLRGVNVGGNRKVPMADLRELFGDLGFTGVRSYIQSGNVVFESGSGADRLRSEIEAGIAERFGFDVDVVIRSRERIADVVAADPFPGEDLDQAKLAVVFLAEPLTEEVRDRIEVPAGLPERVVVTSTELFIHYPDGMGRSKLERSAFWKPLAGRTLTVRNRRTVVKLHEMLSG